MEVVKDDAYTSSLDESPVLVFITAVFINKSINIKYILFDGWVLGVLNI